ncbi:hypothetical protein [Azoarcus olearius]|uniref:Conserved hypothetical membrane protein n=1 Tax=Azoarcus sp. (strain BH72) TaxID=418699 RepID=A1K305_AZOSB|nr:hypothetical protein [Azoarcus olearius]ANQ83736.1 hypothetical protein dqs_0661 [Azoarcus olearius]CAL93210.1 conserved hypothetical membrane protein [Azoarcus olearius]
MQIRASSPPAAARRRIPVAAWLLGVPGLAALGAGLALLLGDFSGLHPILAEPGTALALIVSALALLGSAAFPLVLAHLARQDGPAPGQ